MPSLGIVKENVVLSVVFAQASFVVARALIPKLMIKAKHIAAKYLEIADSMKKPFVLLDAWTYRYKRNLMMV